MAVEIGALRALLSLDSAAFDKGAKRAQASMNGLQRSLHKTSQRMRSIGKTMTKRMTLPLAGVAAVAVKSSLTTIDAQSKMAQSLNTSTRSMQVLERAADRAGISAGELEQVGRQLTKRLSQVAATGKGPAAGALEKIGLRASDLADMDLDQKIAVINRAIKETVPEAEQAAVSMALFGDRAGIMAGRLDADTIATASDEIERFGIAVSEVEADAIEEANDAISAIGLVTRGLANQIAVSLAPTLKTIAEYIADLGHWFSSLSPEVRKFIGIGAALAAVIGPLAIALGFVAAGIAALASPIGLAVLAFGAVVGVAAAVAANWDKLVEKFPILETGLNMLKSVFSSVWEGIKGIVNGATQVIEGAIKLIVGVLTNDLKLAISGLTGIWEGWEAISEAAVNAVLGIMEAVVPGFRQTVADIIAVVSALPERLKQWGMDAIQGFVDGIFEKWTALKEKVTSIFSLRDVNAETAAAGRAIGRDLGAGLGVGLAETQPGLEQQTRDYINAIEGAARDETETQSPSRVWMRLGRDLMDGLGVGIADGAQAAATSAATAANRVTAAASAAQPALNTMPDKLRESTSEANTLGNRLAGMLSGAAKAASSFSDFLGNILNQLSDMFLDQAFQSLFGGNGSGGSGGGGGFLGGLIGSFAGMFDKGGRIPSGQFGVAGENGPEIITGPANVVSTRDTAAIGGGGTFNIYVSGARGNTEIREMVAEGIQQARGGIVKQSVGSAQSSFKRSKSAWSPS